MSRWWRAYDEAVDDPKLILLTDQQHRSWFNLCCIASQSGGALPTITVIAVKLRVKPDRARHLVAELVALGLIDKADGGKFEMHNWRRRQFKSDGSTERVKRFRNEKRNVSCNVSETANETKSKQDQSQIQKQKEKEDDGDRGREAENSAIEKPKPPLIRPEAYPVAAECLKVLGFPSVIDAPVSFAGLPYQVEMLLSRGVSPPTIVGKFAELREHRSKSMNYFIRAVENAHTEQSNPRPIDGRDARPTIYGKLPAGGNIVAAADRLIERLADFDRPGPPTVRGGSGEAAVRLLPKG